MRNGVTVLMVLGLVVSAAPALAVESPSPNSSSSVSTSPSASQSPSPTATPTVSPTPTTTPTAGPYGIPMNQKIRPDSWCQLLIPASKGDAGEADSIMQDSIVDLGQYGYYRLSANPNWKPQSTLDSSGNTHVNGLYWAVPLLYTGARRGDTEMVRRYFDLVGDWLSKHKKKSTRTWSVTQPIIAGERLWTLTCGADISGGKKFVKATRKEARTQIRSFTIGYRESDYDESEPAAAVARHQPPDLGRQPEGVAGLPAQEAAHPALALAGTVERGGIEVAHARVPGGGESGRRILLVDGTVQRADGRAAEAQR